jgi:hypothetical protein
MEILAKAIQDGTQPLEHFLTTSFSIPPLESLVPKIRQGEERHWEWGMVGYTEVTGVPVSFLLLKSPEGFTKLRLLSCCSDSVETFLARSSRERIAESIGLATPSWLKIVGKRRVVFG